jgi:DNA-binding CsgD family transcriptional regulator
LTNLRAKVASLPYWVYCENSRFAVLFRSRRDEGSSETPITCSVVTFTTRGGLIREVWVSAGNLQSNAEPEVDWVRRWRLTPREVSVALLAAEGLRDKEIAVQLDLATASVSKYLTRVMHKAGARGRWDLPRLTGTAKLR